MALSSRKEGDSCIVCGSGVLEIVFGSKAVGETTQGIVGMPVYKKVVEYLACTECCLVYHTERRGELLDKGHPFGSDGRC